MGCEGEHSAQRSPYARIVEIDPTDTCLAQTRRQWQLVHRLIADEGSVDAVKRGHEALQHAPESRNDSWEARHHTPTSQLVSVMHGHFDAQDVLAFGVRLQGQVPEVDLEHREVIREGLDHDLEPRRRVACAVPVRTPSGAEEGSDLAHIQAGTRSVDQTLKNLLQLTAPLEQQVPTVFDLIHRVGIVEAGLLLLVDAQRETQARRVDPALAHLDQAPYSPCFGQGVCNPGQVCGVGDLSEAVVLLGEGEMTLGGLAGDVLVPIQNDLCAERRMARHLDGDVPPLGVHDVERVND